MTQRNDVPLFTQSHPQAKSQPSQLSLRQRRWSTTNRRSSRLFMRLGYCLGGMGLFSSTIAQAQAPIANSVVIPTGTTVEQALSAAPETVAPGTASTRAADLQPERILEVESASSQAKNDPPAPNTAVLEVPEVATEVATPRQAVKEGYEAPSQVVVIDRSADDRSKPSIPKPPASQLGKSVAKGQKSQSKVSQQPPHLVVPEPPQSVAAAETAAPPAYAAPAVRIGPVSFSSAGISISSSAVQPYFNPNLRQARLPGLENLRLMFPVAIPAPITSLFGWRVHPISGAQRMHTGTDIGAPMGTPVLAALAGRVILADSLGGYGFAVALEHENGIRQTLYAHMSELFVRPGDVVQQGTVIGRVGSTGASTGPHLHFELRQMLPDGTWVAEDAGKSLELAMSSLIQSLQIAQQPQKAVAQRPNQAVFQRSSYPPVKSAQ